MIVDSSAIVAAITSEPDAARFRQAILTAPTLAMSAVMALETWIILYARHGQAAIVAFEELLGSAAVEVVAFDAIQA